MHLPREFWFYVLGVFTLPALYVALLVLITLADAAFYASGVMWACAKFNRRAGASERWYEWPVFWCVVFFNRFHSDRDVDRITFRNGDEWRAYFTYIPRE